MLIPFHAKLDEVEPLITEARSAIHIGTGKSVVEAVWSMKFFEEITFTDVDENKLGVLAGFIQENFPNIHITLEIEPIHSDMRLDCVLRALSDMRRSLGLRRLRAGFRARRIRVRRLDILDLKEFHEKFDFVLFFGFTSVFKEALNMGYSLPSLILNIRRLLKPSGTAILSDFLPKENVMVYLDDLRVKRAGNYTFYIRS